MQNINDARCDALCIRDGYDHGTSTKALECICSENKGKYQDYLYRRVLGLPRNNGTVSSGTSDKKIDSKSGYVYFSSSEGEDEH